MATCVRCGCTDDAACVDAHGETCAWAMKYLDGSGICTFCDVADEPFPFETLIDIGVDEPTAAPSASRLILPGDPEFHL